MVPLFVFDREILAGGFAAANRLAFLLAALGDLRVSLRQPGGRPGRPPRRPRQERLRSACAQSFRR